MIVKSKLDHANINVTNIERSAAFYSEALGLTISGQIHGADGAFDIAYLSDGVQAVTIELTYLADHTESYDLGENESHLCFKVEGDYDEIREFHRSKGWICYENHDMGLYFINDPDDYWIEILAANRK